MINQVDWNRANTDEKLNLLKQEIEMVIPTMIQASRSSTERDQRLFEELRKIQDLLEKLKPGEK